MKEPKYIPDTPKASGLSVAHDAFARSLRKRHEKQYGGNAHGSRLLLDELVPQPKPKLWGRLSLGGTRLALALLPLLSASCHRIGPEFTAREKVGIVCLSLAGLMLLYFLIVPPPAFRDSAKKTVHDLYPHEPNSTKPLPPVKKPDTMNDFERRLTAFLCVFTAGGTAVAFMSGNRPALSLFTVATIFFALVLITRPPRIIAAVRALTAPKGWLSVVMPPAEHAAFLRFKLDDWAFPAACDHGKLIRGLAIDPQACAGCGRTQGGGCPFTPVLPPPARDALKMALDRLEAMEHGKATVQGALDSLADRLPPPWTEGERAIYEQACRILGNPPIEDSPPAV